MNPIQPLPWKYKKREEFDGDGIYCFYPFDSPLDKFGKGIFKIGMTLNIHDRTYGYHTYFPEGVFIFAVLKNPDKGLKDKKPNGEPKYDGKEGKQRFIKAVEAFIFKEVIKAGGHRVTMDIRKKKERQSGFTPMKKRLIMHLLKRTKSLVG